MAILAAEKFCFGLLKFECRILFFLRKLCNFAPKLGQVVRAFQHFQHSFSRNYPNNNCHISTNDLDTLVSHFRFLQN